MHSASLQTCQTPTVENLSLTKRIGRSFIIFQRRAEDGTGLGLEKVSSKGLLLENSLEFEKERMDGWMDGLPSFLHSTFRKDSLPCNGRGRESETSCSPVGPTMDERETMPACWIYFTII